MHLLKIRVRTGTRTNLDNLFVGISFSFIALPSERFSLSIVLPPLIFYVNRMMNIRLEYAQVYHLEHEFF